MKFRELVANAAIYSTALDLTDAANALAAEGHPVDTDDLATITPYITRTIRRFGDWVLDLEPPGSSGDAVGSIVIWVFRRVAVKRDASTARLCGGNQERQRAVRRSHGGKRQAACRGRPRRGCKR